MDPHSALAPPTAQAPVERAPAWWDWPAELVTGHAHAIMAGAPAGIERIATGNGLEIWSSEVRVFLLAYGPGGDSAEDRTGSAG